LSGALSVTVYDVEGRLVADLSRSVRHGSVIWDAKAQSSGLYFVRIGLEKQVLASKVLLLR